MPAHWSDGHGARAGVGQQVDEHVLGLEQEEVVAGSVQRRLALARESARIGSTVLMRNGSMMVLKVMERTP